MRKQIKIRTIYRLNSQAIYIYNINLKILKNGGCNILHPQLKVADYHQHRHIQGPSERGTLPTHTHSEKIAGGYKAETSKCCNTK